MANLNSLPKLPRASKPGQDCACGCGLVTRGGRFVPGHDARLAGLIKRIKAGVLTEVALRAWAGDRADATVAAIRAVDASLLPLPTKADKADKAA